eukprot:5082613-Karenia_brevis.AAC.1
MENRWRSFISSSKPKAIMDFMHHVFAIVADLDAYRLEALEACGEPQSLGLPASASSRSLESAERSRASSD